MRVRLGERGRVLVVLLPAGEVLRRERRDPRELRLGEREIGGRDRRALRRLVDLFLTHAGRDIGEIGARGFRVRFRLLERRGDLGARQFRQRLALAHRLPGRHGEGFEPSRDLRSDADFRLVHDADERRFGIVLDLVTEADRNRRADGADGDKDRQRATPPVHDLASLRLAIRLAATAMRP